MSGKKNRFLLLFFISSLSFFNSSAQLVFPAKYEVGLNVGLYVYQGDLVPSILGSFRTARPGVGIYLGRTISPSFSLGAAFNVSSLEGDDALYDKPEFRKHRAFRFKSSLKELSLQAKYNLTGFFAYQPRLQPYIFAGIGVAVFNTEMDYSRLDRNYFSETSSTVVGLATDIVKPAKKTKPVLPLGVGLRYDLSSNFTLNMETAYRLTNTDYIDGFSLSANPKLNDHYLSQTVGVSYKFGRKSKYDCPVVKL
jgi:opacity protein-like surface antigen